MSIATEITRIQGAKNDLKTSINAKTDSEHQITNETIDDYADFVDSIQTGGGGSSARLPSEYQEVEYIQSSGTQYFVTDYYANGQSQYEFKYSEASTGGVVFGAYNNAWTTGNGFYHNASTNQYEYFHYYSNNATSLRGSSSNVYELSIDKGNVYSNGVIVSQTNTKTFTLNYPTYVLAGNWAGSRAEQPISCKLYYFKIKEDNVLIHYYVPCYRKADSVIGVYDLVDKEFLTNSGSGTFTKGADHDTPNINLQNKTETITTNTTTNITADAGYDALNQVTVVTNVNQTLETKSVTILKNGTTTVTPSSGYYGLSTVNISTSVPTSGGGIPSGYTQLEYIETNAVGYITLDYKATDATEFEFTSQLLNVGSYDGALLGSRTTPNGSDEFVVWHNTGSGATTETLSPRRGSVSSSYVSKSWTNSDFSWRKCRIASSSVYIDDVYYGKMYSQTLTTSNLNLYLFSINYNNSADTRYYRGRLKYLKINDGVQPVLNLLPAKRNSDSAVGLYDIINGTFYTNELSTNFTAGSVVE